jgi:hypothetical protein
MSNEDMQAELERLRAENESLKAKQNSAGPERPKMLFSVYVADGR